MKKSFLLLSLIGGFAYITLTSNSTGYTVSNQTGSDGATTIGCGVASSCHGTSATSTIVPNIILDSAGTGTYVTKYTPGKSYVIRFGTLNTTTGMLPSFGFQLSVVKANMATHTNAGSFPSGVTGADTFGTGITVWTHTTPLAHATGSGGPGSSYLVSIPWTAPAAGMDSVKIFGVINLVDSSNTATTADKWNTAKLTVLERKVSEVPTVAKAQFNAYPNPVLSNLTLDLNNIEAGDYSVQVYDLTGKLMVKQDVSVTGNTSTVINMQQCVPGIYHVVIGKDGISKVISVNKQ